MVPLRPELGSLEVMRQGSESAKAATLASAGRLVIGMAIRFWSERMATNLPESMALRTTLKVFAWKNGSQCCRFWSESMATCLKVWHLGRRSRFSPRRMVHNVVSFGLKDWPAIKGFAWKDGTQFRYLEVR